MKVIVNVSGFYGGTWFEARRTPQDMPDAIACAFLPPHGDQLSVSAARKGTEKPVAPVAASEKKAG